MTEQGSPLFGDPPTGKHFTGKFFTKEGYTALPNQDPDVTETTPVKAQTAREATERAIAHAETRDMEKAGSTALSPEENLWLNTLAPQAAPPGQKMILLSIARAMGFNPMLKEIMLIPTWSAGAQAWQVVVGIHGIIKKAQESPQWGGIQSAAVFEGDEIEIDAKGSVRHTYNPIAENRIKPGSLPLGAWASVTRIINGNPTVTTKFLRFRDYAKFKEGKPVGSYLTQGPHMIETRAKAFACREAFADAIGAIYTREEFDSGEDT